MERRIDAHIARTQFGQIMDRATKNNDRFIVNRRHSHSYPDSAHPSPSGTANRRDNRLIVGIGG